jgi:NAD(P)H-flavin reductase
MVTSWSPDKQGGLELFAQTRSGLTATLQACAAKEGSASFVAFVTGPHGPSTPVSQYETVLAVASGFGIAGVVSHLRQLLHGYNTSTSRVRRVHLVWQMQSLGKSSPRYGMLETKTGQILLLLLSH